MDTVKSWLLWIVGFFVLILFIAGIMFFTNTASEGTKKVQSQTKEQLSALSDSEFASYENGNLQGSDVVQAVKRFKNRPAFSIFIRTGVNQVGFYAQNADNLARAVCYGVPASPSTPVNTAVTTCTAQTSYLDMMDTTLPNSYVNPSGTFRSTVFRDSNGEVRLLAFEQQ